jgi:hypothetical protein
MAATAGALALAFSLFQWQDWESDRAALAANELARAHRLAAEASATIEGRRAYDMDRANAIFQLSDDDDDEVAAAYFSDDGRRTPVGSETAGRDCAKSSPRWIERPGGQVSRTSA